MKNAGQGNRAPPQMISDKVYRAAKARAEKEAPPPDVEPMIAGFRAGMVCFLAVALFIALRWSFSLDPAWMGTAAIGATLAWWEARAKARRNTRAVSHWIDFYKDDPRL